MNRGAPWAWLVAFVLTALVPGVPGAASPPPTSQDPTAPPSAAEVEYYTRPLVRARLSVPDSLRDYTVASVGRSADEAARFDVEVRFRARTPFGATTAHSARFRMKRAAENGGWIVTAP